jgi:hypothetical protein
MSRMTAGISANGRNVARQGDGFRKCSTHPTSRLRRPAHRVVDQRLAERPDRAGDLVTGGDDRVERGLDPVAARRMG